MSAAIGRGDPLRIDLERAQVLFPDGMRVGRISLADGRITDAAQGRSVDLTGFLLLPGIVDAHGDAFERHVAPRRGAVPDVAEGLRAAEAEIAANGITTAIMAQFISWEGGLRGPDFAGRVFAAIADLRPLLATDLRAQCRFETHLSEFYDTLPGQLAEWGVDYLVFNDHLPHARLAEGRKPPRLTGQALKAGMNPERYFDRLLKLHARGPEVEAALPPLAARLAAQGVRLGSHDDPGAQTRQVWSRRGVRISEFPETDAAARAARAGGDHIVMGAPNALRGTSHKGNVAARGLIAAGLCDALASDYHYPAPRRAALALAGADLAGLPGAWALVSSRPARMLGLDDRGRLLPGLRADIAVLEQATGRVAATIAGGRVSYLQGAAALRFVGQGG